MEKYAPAIKSVLILVFIAAGFYFLTSVFSKARRRLNGVVNFDTFHRRFVYRVDLPVQAVVSKLRIPNQNDRMRYELSDDLSQITFPPGLGTCELRLEPQDDGCILYVRVFERFPDVGPHLVYDVMNEFWIKKLHAKPIDFYDWLRFRNENGTRDESLS